MIARLRQSRAIRPGLNPFRLQINFLTGNLLRSAKRDVNGGYRQGCGALIANLGGDRPGDFRVIPILTMSDRRRPSHVARWT
jgi:hypothetical protein